MPVIGNDPSGLEGSQSSDINFQALRAENAQLKAKILHLEQETISKQAMIEKIRLKSSASSDYLAHLINQLPVHFYGMDREGVNHHPN